MRKLREGIPTRIVLSLVILALYLFVWRGLLNYENAVAVIHQQHSDFPNKVKSQAEWDALGTDGHWAYLQANVRPTFEVELKPGERTGWIDRAAGVFFYDIQGSSRAEVVYENGSQEVIESEDSKWSRHGIKRIRVTNTADKTVWMKVWNLVPWQ